MFTIHAGEFIVGDYIEHTFQNVSVWVPTKDTGVDLLLSGKNKEILSLQVKFSRDFLLTHMKSLSQTPLRAQLRTCGWFTLNREKILESRADYWIFVLVGLKNRSTDFVIIKPAELLKRLDAIHPDKKRICQTYLWVTENLKCWETRGLNLKDQLLVAQGKFEHKERGFSEYFGHNGWKPIKKLNDA